MSYNFIIIKQFKFLLQIALPNKIKYGTVIYFLSDEKDIFNI